MKVREPVARPLDVVAIELLLSASQALVVGVMMYLAVGLWDDRGVGSGPVAIILAILGLAVGAAWLFWLLGGVGWPLAAANVPTAMFLGFAVILGWQGDGLIRLDPLPMVLALAGSIYGVVGGVFIDSPRRWRWDQRQKLRAGTQVPRVSPATRTAIAAIPRSLPRRSAAPDGGVAPAGIGAGPDDHASGGARSTTADPSGDVGLPYLSDDRAAKGSTDPAVKATDDSDDADAPDDALEREGASGESGATRTRSSFGPGSTSAMSRASGAGGAADEEARSTDAIELPTSVEPKAQRSPWAWAAPPEWSRDEDDEPSGGTSGRSS